MKNIPVVVLESKAGLAEGPVWDSHRQQLWWVDIGGGSINRYDLRTSRNDTFPLHTRIGALTLTQGSDLLLATHHGFTRFDPQTGILAKPISPADHDTAQLRFNDGKCDPAGRFLAGSTSLAGKNATGSLYSFEDGGKIQTLLRGIALSNGLTWSVNGRLFYYIDTLTHSIAAFPYDVETGRLGEGRTVISIPPRMGYPDGMTIDNDGMLWIALWGGGAVTRWDPRTGSLLEKHPLPVSQVTSCSFGGPKLDTLYITTARADLSSDQLEKESLAGSIFSLRSDVGGAAPHRFQG
ncbi:SMP-30/gluconolaconase/LRE domain protein [Nibricoccus aquaticus]|uniref:SMP-30/gluconolaconase/LRE domain protein n=2 Tax=Nibricoccus aquaticus TaxID=2576891 RepID=A0A290QAX5_9BACT|nr:SMP-30/gluconolaconase/LRE domain protein [Nibricoccus aquaticus]